MNLFVATNCEVSRYHTNVLIQHCICQRVILAEFVYSLLSDLFVTFSLCA